MRIGSRCQTQLAVFVKCLPLDCFAEADSRFVFFALLRYTRAVDTQLQQNHESDKYVLNFDVKAEVRTWSMHSFCSMKPVL